ncbi:ANTAR domain-containing protein [Rhodococcus sp. IEGM 248]|jgi:hypothetical protein|uniref:ANTAR domain-containing protein n=1 Tax=Rhodococcus TaxID=1827 RepID=UPI00076A982C|nr:MULTISPECIES: ANTAR domain-containing protein [Rhodococcus]KXF56574.1 antitermination regulator [Rhodococcus sp. SC4]NDV07048.1 ANTAR domain-containing protein [Rhodococcus sp. IEGM 248]RZK83793.1 MAG: ANTAR domain-containing protein [Rhodococcus sp. (in: high G+C Gram-positive bacteria)]KXX61834.1 antitermination regulator [Rhodococcus sp. LB1]MDV7089373.1 ANTAR domain-containing protein [Rhodococcus opacus]
MTAPRHQRSTTIQEITVSNDVLEAAPPAHSIPHRHPDGREVLATAKGILIATRGYGDAEAFEELLDVSRHHHVSVMRAAKSLVELATRRQPCPSVTTPAPSYALEFKEWTTLLAR